MMGLVRILWEYTKGTGIQNLGVGVDKRNSKVSNLRSPG